MKKQIITDHEHAYEERGKWRTGRCLTCGNRVTDHLSYQEEFQRSLDKLLTGES